MEKNTQKKDQVISLKMLDLKCLTVKSTVKSMKDLLQNGCIFILIYFYSLNWERCISPLEIYKENTAKEIPRLKFLMKLFQHQKLYSELNDFQSILIVSSHSPFLNKERGWNFWKMSQGTTNYGGHFLILNYHCNWHCFCILF